MTNQPNPTSSEPMAWMTMDHSARRWNLTFENPEPVKQHLLAIKELYTHPTPTLSGAELGQVLDALKIGLSDTEWHEEMGGGTERKDKMLMDRVLKIRAAIALLEKGKI